MSYEVDRDGQRQWTPTRRFEGDDRATVDLTDALGLQQSRARLWRYPAGAKGRRHLEHAQEEVFVVLAGRLTLAVGEPPERVEVESGGVAKVAPETPLQVRNEGDDELVLLIYGAPPVAGQAEHLEDAEPG